MRETDLIARPGFPQIVARRELPVPRSSVFRAFIEPDLLSRWIGPDNLETTVEILEPRHGGRWRYVHRDGLGNTYVFHGVYHGDPTEERIVQTYEFDSEPGVVYLNTIDLDQIVGGTLLSQATVFQSVDHRDRYLRTGAAAAINHSFSRLEALLLAEN